MSTLQHVPPWVFVLLGALVVYGVTQAFPRRVTLRRSMVLPAALIVMSLAGVVSSFGALPLALVAWAAGVGLAVAALHGRVDVSAVRFSARRQQLQLPGSWVPLLLMMGLFATKFVAGAALARNPALAGSAPFALATSAAYGLFSGTFLARAMALWTLARRTLQPVGQALA